MSLRLPYHKFTRESEGDSFSLLVSRLKIMTVRTRITLVLSFPFCLIFPDYSFLLSTLSLTLPDTATVEYLRITLTVSIIFSKTHQMLFTVNNRDDVDECI